MTIALLPQAKPTIESVIAETVEEARAGDQVAIGLIMATRDNAIAGEPRAKHTLAKMIQYTDANPVDEAPIVNRPGRGVATARPLIIPATNPQLAAFGIDESFPAPPLIHSRPDMIHELPVVAELIAPKRGSLCVFGIWLSFGPQITNRHLDRIIGTTMSQSRDGDRIVDGILAGWGQPVEDSLGGMVDSAFSTGHFLGSALREGWKLQGVRSGSLPVHVWSPEVAWELGE